MSHRGESAGSGSGSVTSSPAPPRWPGLQSGDQGRRVDHRSAPDVVDHGARFHRRERRRIEQSARVRRMRQGDHHMIGVRQRLMKVLDRRTRFASRRRRQVAPAAQPVDAHAKRGGALGDCLTDVAHADDQHGLALQLRDFVVRRFMSRHALARLRLDQSRETASERDHHAQHMLGHVRRRHAARVGHHDPARGDCRQIVALDAGARGVHPAQLGAAASSSAATRQPMRPSASRKSSSGWRRARSVARSSAARVFTRHNESNLRKIGAKPRQDSSGTSMAKTIVRSGGDGLRSIHSCRKTDPFCDCEKHVEIFARCIYWDTRICPRDGGMMPEIVYTSAGTPLRRGDVMRVLDRTRVRQECRVAIVCADGRPCAAMHLALLAAFWLPLRRAAQDSERRREGPLPRRKPPVP